MATLIIKKVDIELLNTLPSYFQSLRNSLAQAIRSLARDINNDPYNNYKSAFEIIEIANNISTDGLTKQTISRGYYTIKKNYDDSLPKSIALQTQPAVSVAKPIAENGEETEEDEIQQKSSEYKSNTFYKVYLFACCCTLIWALFNSSTKYIVLSIYAGMYLFAIYKFVKKPSVLKANSTSDKLFFFTSVVICASAYFNINAATFFLLYQFAGCCFTLYYDLILNKSYNKNKSFAFLMIALIGTYYLNTDENIFKYQNSEKTQQAIEILTDQQYFENGQVFFNQGDFPKAIIQYSSAIKLNPSYSDAFLARGASKANIGQYDLAIIDYLKSEELGCKKSELYSNFGIAYYQLKQIDNAKINIEKALVIDPTNANAYRYRGEIKYDANDNKGSIEDYTFAIQYNPNASNYFARGLGYYYLKDYKNAIQDMDKAIELNPHVGQYYFDRGDAKDQISDFSGACRDWKIAKEKSYDVPEYKSSRCIPQIIYVTNGELKGCSASSKHNKNLSNQLVITVGSNANVAVKLINYLTQESIRYVFINKNTTYTIRNIPEGKYYLKIAYGDDWSIMQGQPNCSGRFTKNTLFEKGEEILDYNLVYSGDNYQVPSFSLKLDVIITEDKMSNFNTDKINENDFYNE